MSKKIISDEATRMPAEWERQSAIMLTWPHRDTDWLPILDDITSTYLQIVRTIAAFERLIIVAPCTSDVKKLISSSIPETLSQITFFDCPTNDTWARDHAFITLSDRDNNRYLLDFCFNGWGAKFAADKDNAINRCMFDAGILTGEYIDHLDFVLEGGSVESNGKGTVFTTTGCLTAPHRNQPLSKDEIEEILKQYLHAERILWLNHGSLIGDDTDGHIDTLVRIAPDDTLLYMSCQDAADPQYADLKAMEAELEQWRTSEGHPYRLLPLELPSAIYDEGDRLPATYANYLVVNGAVIVPTYACQKTDDKAMETIASAFPDRKIIGIDARHIIRQHGSIHCCAMQYY